MNPTQQSPVSFGVSLKEAGVSPQCITAVSAVISAVSETSMPVSHSWGIRDRGVSFGWHGYRVNMLEIDQ